MARSNRFDFRWLIVIVLLVAVLGVAVAINTSKVDESASKLLGGTMIDNSDLKVDWSRYQSVDIQLDKSLSISESGIYHLTGSIDDGQIVVDAGIGEVKLILDNVHVNNTTGPAILAKNAENLVIELVGGNYLMDGDSYDANYDQDVNGVIYSKADLAFCGNGTLNINANFGDGIVGKDDVVFRDGTYKVIAKDDGIRGKDSVYITGGNFAVESGDDAIKSTNNTDFGKGFIMIENGELLLNTTGKGLNAENTIMINGGIIFFNTYDDAVHSNNHAGITNGALTINSNDDGINADNELIIDGGSINITKS